jgi:predicted membrane chloride channel (bestrophin family)
MLVIPGYIEKGQFVPDSPALIADRARATLMVEDHAAISEEENRRAWGEFIEAIRNIKDEELTGMPEPVQFRTPEEIDRL